LEFYDRFGALQPLLQPEVLPRESASSAASLIRGAISKAVNFPSITAEEAPRELLLIVGGLNHICATILAERSQVKRIR